MILTNARVVLEDCILEQGSVAVENGLIASVSAERSSDGGAIDCGGNILAPGFVDIHCHGGGNHWFFESPTAAAQYHLKEGTTSLLCSLWRNAGTYSYEQSITKILRAMKYTCNIRGIHMEGPYLDPDYGSEHGTPHPIKAEEYRGFLDKAKGTIRQWTFDPCQEGAKEFAKTMQEQGIVLGVCYSKATPELLEEFVPYGLRMGNHILCGSGSAKPRYKGTKEPGSDEFVLYNDAMFAEVIADSLGAHVRPFYLKYIYRLKGADKVALVSDCCAGGDTCGSNVNIINDELYGSRLTLSVALRNMRRHTGAPLVDLIKMASTTPARAVGLYKTCGSIAPGKRADLVCLNEDLLVQEVYLGGKSVLEGK